MVALKSDGQGNRSNSQAAEQLLRISLDGIVVHHEWLRAYQLVLNRRAGARTFSKYYRAIHIFISWSMEMLYRPRGISL